jgi:hypothetical protein
MSLADFIVACTQSGISLAYSFGRLSLRPSAAVTPELKAAAAEHKAALLPLLAPELSEAECIAREGNGLAWDELPLAIAEFEAVVVEDGEYYRGRMAELLGYGVSLATAQQIANKDLQDKKWHQFMKS